MIYNEFVTKEKMEETVEEKVEEKVQELPPASEDKQGLVKSSSDINGVAVADDGKMSVNSVNVTKLYQDDLTVLELYGGNAGGGAQ